MVEKFLSCFEITENNDETIPWQHRQKGKLKICSKHVNPGKHRPLKLYSNRKNHRYEENYLEEWIAREPSALFPDQEVMIIASQNYIFLQEKIDLLFLNQDSEFQIVELKIEPITPHTIWEQVQRYTQFLLRIDDPYIHFSSYYSRFSEKFYGHSYDFSQQVEKCCEKKLDIPPQICKIYVAECSDECSDEYSVNFLFEKGQQEKNKVRCIFYKFFPQDDVHYIEFWEVFPN